MSKWHKMEDNGPNFYLLEGEGWSDSRINDSYCIGHVSKDRSSLHNEWSATFNLSDDNTTVIKDGFKSVEDAKRWIEGLVKEEKTFDKYFV